MDHALGPKARDGKLHNLPIEGHVSPYQTDLEEDLLESDGRHKGI